MNAGMKRIVAGGVGAVMLAGSVLASSGPASARPLHHGYHRYAHHHHGYGGGAFPGLIAGLIGGIAIAALSHPHYYDDEGPYYYGGYPDYGYAAYPTYSYGYGYAAPYRYGGFRHGGFHRGFGGGGFHHGFGGFHPRPGGFHPAFAGGGHRGGGAVIWRHR